jgi:hypothetical protein
MSAGSSRLVEGANAAAAASIVGLTVAGITLQDWAAIAALLYTLWLLVEKAIAAYKRWRGKREREHGD